MTRPTSLPSSLTPTEPIFRSAIMPGGVRIDSFLIWRLTGGSAHVTDVSNASRTLLFNIHTLEWDDELLRAARRAARDAARGAGIERASTAKPTPALLAAPMPIAGAAGDQQAALFGQACFEPGARRTRTAPAASCCSIPVARRCRRRTAC